jgi:hypothetical protein
MTTHLLLVQGSEMVDLSYALPYKGKILMNTYGGMVV